MPTGEEAIKNSKKGLSCAQTIITTYSDCIDLSKEDAKAISAGFGGGIGYLGKTCGAVSGSVMAIGYKYFDKDDPKASKKKIYKKTKEFFERFEKKFGCSDCESLLGIKLYTEEGLLKFRKDNIFEKKCSDFLKEACNILEDIL